MCPKQLGHKDARVHYAIHKQQPDNQPTPPPRHPSPKQARTGMAGDQPWRKQTHPGLQAPTPQRRRPPTARRETVRSLRTQQCAQPAPAPRSRFPTPRPCLKRDTTTAVLAGQATHDQLNNQCSTNEHATHQTLADDRDDGPDSETTTRTTVWQHQPSRPSAP